MIIAVTDSQFNTVPCIGYLLIDITRFPWVQLRGVESGPLSRLIQGITWKNRLNRVIRKKPSIFSSKEICSWPSDILFLDCPYSYQIPVYRVLSVGCRGASRIVVWWLDHFRKPFTINFNAYVELIFQSNNKIVYFIFYFKVTMAPGLP